MKFLGNIIWLICGGLLTAVEYLISSLLLMITIIGIPFGLQTLKLGMLALWPFGSRVTDNGNSGGCLCLVMNVIWIFIGGFWICLTHLFFGLLLCITIIGIPFGRHITAAAKSLFHVHHDYRHSFRQTAFQDGRTGSFAVRKKYRLREKDSLSPDSPVVLPHTSASVDWQIIHSTNRICSTSTG